MSSAETPEIALLRCELRTCRDTGDREGADLALHRLWQLIDADTELVRAARQWSSRFDVAP